MSAARPKAAAMPVNLKLVRSKKLALRTKVTLAVVLMFIAVNLVLIGSIFREDLLERWERAKYGPMPTLNLSEWVGMREQGKGPTKILSINNGRQIVVEVLPGGDRNLAKTICILDAIGEDARWWRGYLELKHLNADKDLDLVLTVRGQEYIFYNKDQSFVTNSNQCIKSDEGQKLGVQLSAPAATEHALAISSPTKRITGMKNPPPVLRGKPLSVVGEPTITIPQILRVLQRYNSPIADPEHAEFIYDIGVRWGIDPAIALGQFVQESSAGTQEIGARNRNFGNIKVGMNNPFNEADGFRKYPTWKAGIEDYYRLIATLYVKEWKLTTLEGILYKYAPPDPKGDKNDTARYIINVRLMVDQWREESARNFESDNA